jgi:tyrosine-protein kinase TXK
MSCCWFKIEKNCEIPRNELEMGNLLAKGHYSEVNMGRWTTKKHLTVAIKTIKIIYNYELEYLEKVKLLKTVHPNLVQIYGVCMEDRPPLIITELMKKGTLLDFIQSGLNTLDLFLTNY